jgi:probable blue pigment (indigoidine) exporter
MTSNARIIARTALTPMIWGTTYIVTTELLPPNSPLLTAVLRALPAGLVLVAITRRLPTGAWWWRAAVLGTLNIGVFFALLFVAAYRLPGGVAAVLGAIGPLLTIGLSSVLLKVRPVGWAIIAGLTGVLGVGLVVLRPNAGYDPIGITAGLLGTVSMAFGTVLTKRWGRPDNVGALAFTGWQLTAGGLLLAPVALLVGGLPAQLTMTNIAGYGYLAVVGTALAYWVWFRGVAALPASSVAFLALLSPIMAAAIGWALLGQALTPIQLLGGLIALGSTVLGQRAASRPASVPPVAAGEQAPSTERLPIAGARQEPAGIPTARALQQLMIAGREVAQGRPVVADLMPEPLAHDEARVARDRHAPRHRGRRECVPVGWHRDAGRLGKVGQQRRSGTADQPAQRRDQVAPPRS